MIQCNKEWSSEIIIELPHEYKMMHEIGIINLTNQVINKPIISSGQSFDYSSLSFELIIVSPWKNFYNYSPQQHLDLWSPAHRHNIRVQLLQ